VRYRVGSQSQASHYGKATDQSGCYRHTDRQNY
jgi:hypothetical protein